MLRIHLGIAASTLAVAGALFSTVGGAAAEGAFLCPIVGDGLLNADMRNGDHGVEAIQPPAGTSLLPGKNQVGPHANPNAFNEFGGPAEGNTPGSPGFTPIWNP